MRLTTAGVALLLLVLYANNPSDAWTHNWHAGPINCYTCTTAEECAASAGRFHKCVGNDAQSCVAVFNTAGVVVQRGCSDELVDTCKDANCYECRSHGCNNLKDNAKLIECVLCDAETDENCVKDIELIKETRECNEHCITALYPRTSDVGAPLELVRTCLDDLDLDDREACAEGTLNNCAACNEANCNTVEMGSRSSCNFCADSDCDKVESKTCRAVAAEGFEEQCFIQLNEANKVSDLGCGSQHNVTDLELLQEKKRIWLCTGENCNVISALPTPQTCKLCSSRTDPNCAVAPTETTSSTTCEHPLNTDCYTLLRDDGHTERGCLNSLEASDYVDCAAGSNATKCVTCKGEKCNDKLQPTEEERLTCHVCDSSKDNSCVTEPNAPALCVVHRPGQTCVTTIDRDGDTLRGCGDTLNCTTNDDQHCRRCVGKNCNTVDLQRLSDGNPGQWGQELPLSCLSCTDVATCASTSTPTTCSGKNEYCMTVFDESGKVSTRGCSKVVEAAHSAYCDKNGANCPNCNSNDCNNADSLESYTECIYCDASLNPDCFSNAEEVTGRRLCNGQCMTALKPRNGSDVYDAVRGCLDDKDPEDQERCVSGSDSECVACEGPACNKDKLDVKLLTCYACNGADCELPNVAVCVHYSPTDRCYSQFDSTSSVVAQGCKSDLDPVFIESNFEKFHFCEGNNCNSNFPKPNTCSVCSSLDDENCATDPSKVVQFNNCEVLPNTGCMTRVLTDGSTQRGCVSSLSNTLLRSCLKGEGNCDVCEGNMCNKQIYPADRRRCHRCNSVEDPTCATAPTAPGVCPRYNANDGCSVKLVDGATYRGCQTEFTCDERDKQYCRQCKTKDSCNVVDLDIWNIGYPGNWATPPINCYTCEGVECQGSGLGPLQKCHNNDKQNCATVFASNGSVVLRGCSDNLYANPDWTQYCDETPGSCKFCKSTGCNNAKELTSYQDCLICDGTNDADCVRNVDSISRKVSCQGDCFTGLYASNRSAADSPLQLSRGCLDDLTLDDREACAAGNLENCVACSGVGCNKVAVPEDRLSCNYCADSECTEVVSQMCTAYRKDDQCYIHVGDLAINSMGCASDQTSTFLQANRRDLHLCSGDNCNVKDVLNFDGIICNICNSTWYHGCIDKPDALIVGCQHYLHPECYTQITEGGVVRRGCLMDTSDELFDDCKSGSSATCEICDSPLCNKELYPADWSSCLRCDSKNDPDCEKNPASHASYCPTYLKDDGCVVTLEKGRTRRGCQSEIYCDDSEASTCRNCNGNDCNKANLAAGYVGEPGKWQDLPLSCLVCTDLESCATVTAPTTCEGNNKQLCSTVFNEDGKVIARGCSDTIAKDHLTYCEDNNEKCPKCKSNACNNANNLDTYVECYHCDADEDATCAFATPKQTRQCQGQCMTAMYPRSSSVDSALLPTRGCLDDLEEEDRESCAAGNHANCKACTGSLCNVGDIIEKPQQCYICTSADCAEMDIAKCVAYREKDQCYTAFEENSIVAMGCVSDFETQVVNELVAQQRLLVCDGPDVCNSPENIPHANTCLQCSSLNDTRCATNPNQLTSTDICSELPYPQCVTHIDASGRTTRGCLSSLDDDFYGCLMGTSDHCSVCTGTNCNGLTVFPEDRRRCHQCDSASNPNCAKTPNSNTVCPIYDPNDSCVTTIIKDVTYRGCSSSLSCEDPSDSNSCRTCTDLDGCNTVDLELLNMHGSPGTWQEVPISCLTCNSAEGCSSGGGTLEKCVGADNCATVFDATGEAVTARGCHAALEAESTSYCDEQPANCPRCNSNGCNVADSLKDYVQCLVCDSNENPNCVQDVSKITKSRQCYKGCLTAFRNIFDETTNPSYSLVRNCVDDMEEKDRDSCSSGTNKECSVCNNDNCNKEDLVTERHSCLTCRGQGCQDAKPATCANYRENDDCYIEFDEHKSVIGQGCVSEYSLADVYLLQVSKRMLRCEQKDCNKLESIKEPQSCMLCSSRTDRSCAVSPADIKSATSCEWTGIPECYSRVLGDGSTERGCLSNLESDDFLSCYTGTAKNCSSCLGEKCNNQLYPTERTSCHICNSENNADCEAAPKSLSVCPIFDEEDACVTNLRGGVTYRDCASSLSCEPNSKTCVICKGDGCNEIDLSQNVDDGNHGKWQDLPLSCYTCKDAACQQPNVPSDRCASNNEQDCMTVFNAAGAVVARGCEDDIQEDETLASHCTNAANCPVCKSNNCNNADKLTDYNSCIYCDAFTDSSCLWEPTSSKHKRRQCQGKCMAALYGSSETGLDLIRTCLDDKEAADQLTCDAGKDSNCVACSGDACNVQNVPTDRLSCYHCDEGECEDPQPQLCAIYKPKDSCFLWVDEQNSIKQLGCLSSFRNQDLESVIKTKRIDVCQGENCNVPQIQAPVKCAVCDSRDNPACATTPQAVDTFKTCSELPHTHCVSKLESDGATIRGCLYDLPQTPFAACLLGNDTNCELCTKDGCNREIYPADRQLCYTCSSEDDSTCVSNPTRTSACAWLNETETCQTQYQNRVTTRGCSSIVGCSASDFKNCRNCEGTECNAIDLANRVDDGQHGVFQPLPLKCHTCVGEHCLSSLGPAVQCSLNLEQDCKTVFEADGKTVRRRGCADDVDDYEDRHCRQHPELCFTCKSNECNDAWAVTDFTSCVFCNSETDSQCVTYPQSADFAKRQCRDKCMVSLMPNKELLRSCLDDKEVFDRTTCTNDESGKTCSTCENGECNTFAFPSDRLSCHVCTGSGCSSSRAEVCRLYDETDFCFAKYTNGAVQLMGCASAQNSTDLEQWRLSNLLYECTNANCNDLTRLPTSGECISCDSSKTPNCAQSPSEVATTETCHAPLSDCVTRLENGHTIRGCLSALSSVEGNACVANGTCASCAGSKCNVALFPINRRKCHICNSTGNSNCAGEPNHLAVCPIYVADDTCVTSFGSDNFLQRGCGSELECEIDDDKHCQVCNEDGCNTAKFSGSAAISGIGMALTLLVSLAISSWRL